MQPACWKKKIELAKEKAKNQPQTPSNAPSTKTRYGNAEQAAKVRTAPVFDEYKSAGLSLKDINLKNAPTAANEPVPTTTGPAKEAKAVVFTEEELQKVWVAFSESIQQDMPRLYQVMKHKVPELENGTKIKIKVDSETQKSEFQERLAQKLIGFLRDKLENDFIELLLEVVESDEVKNLLFSASDKFNYLLELNPNLQLLKQQFNLDLE